MKALRIILTGALLLNTGCAYRATYFAPEAITDDDYPQRSQVYIYRGDTELVVYTQENNESTWVVIFGKSSEGAIKVPTNGFYISAHGEQYLPISTPWILARDENIPANYVDLNKGERLVVEFQQNLQELEAFTLHVPDIKSGSGNTIKNIEAIRFTRETKWLPLSIN